MADPPFIVAERALKCFWPQPHSALFGVPNSIRYREIFRWDAISMYPNLYDITVYRVISCVITPDRHKTPCCGLRFALAPCLCPLLDWSSAWPFLSSFCCQSDEHITGLTVPLANTISSRLGLLYECMIVFVPFFFFYFPCLLSCYIHPRNVLDIDIGTYRKCEKIA